MVKVTESTREDVVGVLDGLGWILDFWNDKMKLIAIENKMDRTQFLAAKDIGIKFMEGFVLPVAGVYEEKLLEFGPEKTEPAGGTSEEEGEVEFEDGPEADGYISRIPGKRRGRKPGSKNKPKDGTVSIAPVESDRIPVPASLAPETSKVPEAHDPVPSPVTDSSAVPVYGHRRPHTKNRKSWKDGGLSIEQRTQITRKWVDNRGVMNDLKCSDLAKEMGFGGPNQVQGWVSYLTKVCNNNPDYAGREKGWKYMISSGKISDMPVPGFFLEKVEVAFTTRPKAVV